MHGNGSPSFVFLVCPHLIVYVMFLAFCYLFSFLLYFLTFWPRVNHEYLYKFHLIILFILTSSIVAEEEASRLRFYVDEPAFTDLHWV